MEKAKRWFAGIAGAAAISAMAAVEWPSDFDAQLAAHIAAEMSTNTTSAVAGVEAVEPCVRTFASFEFSVKRTPPPKPGVCIFIM